MTYGFIIIRHINSALTNRYWNECVRCIRKLYPLRKIVVIDDNSNQHFVKADFNYNNIRYIQSEFPQRGELLPYYYLYKHAFFDNAIIIHDSVFIEKHIPFENMEAAHVKALPLWHFSEERAENIENTLRIARNLKNNKELLSLLKDSSNSNRGVLGLNNNNNNNRWNGCFGVQSFINRKFLIYLFEKYQIINLLKLIKTRPDRCSLERIMGAIFCFECPNLIGGRKSLLGSIQNPIMKWGYTYEQHRQNMSKNKFSVIPVVKVWSGR